MTTLPNKVLVTGGAGFVGSHVVDRLLGDGHTVVVLDNFSTGRREFLAAHLKNPRFSLVEGDLLERKSVLRALQGVGFVFHLAANADVRFGPDHPRRDLEQNTIATFELLDAMRESGVRDIAFTSTASVYGENQPTPTPEDCPFPVQTSLYGASKVSAEALLAAFSASFQFRTRIFRLVSILGERYTHGHIFDFSRKLLADPKTLSVLGDGQQAKAYLYVGDCARGLVELSAQLSAPVSILNLGTAETITVRQSVRWIAETLAVNPQIAFGSQSRGWVGDIPRISVDCGRAAALKWQPSVSIEEAVKRTTRWLSENRWVFEARP